MIRIFFLLLFLGGVGIGLVYPRMGAALGTAEIGRWPIYSEAAGSGRVDAVLKASQAPVRVFVEATTIGLPELSPDRSLLTLTVAHEGRTVLARALSFASATPRQENLQRPDRIFAEEAGEIPAVETGNYSFVVGPGDAESLSLRSAELILRSGGLADSRAQPLGFVLMAVGVIGFLVTLRRGGQPPQNPNSQPPPPRWGRAAADRR